MEFHSLDSCCKYKLNEILFEDYYDKHLNRNMIWSHTLKNICSVVEMTSWRLQRYSTEDSSYPIDIIYTYMKKETQCSSLDNQSMEETFRMNLFMITSYIMCVLDSWE